MVDLQTAVQETKKFAAHTLGQERTLDIRVEEIESSRVEGDDVWLITISIPLPRTLADFIGARLPAGADLNRDYKQFTVKKDTNEILSMKIRLLAVPAA